MEAALYEDILNALLGFEGKYIFKTETTNGTFMFKLSAEVKKPLSDMVERVIPTCNHYSFVVQYIQKNSPYEFGMVAQAFAAALDSVLKEYGVLIGKLEDQIYMGDFSLQKLHFHLQPAIHNMAVLYTITREAHQFNMQGGALIQHLYKSMTEKSGDAATKGLLHYFLQKATVPYFDMLEEWLYNGCIKDPKGEFMVEQHSNMRKDRVATEYLDEYWQKRFSLRGENISFLSPYNAKILLTGKYLNVIRECGKAIVNPCKGKFEFSERDCDYGDKIEKAYNWACKKLLDVICKDEQLFARLQSLKHYFFLDQGDFFVHFVDISEEELEKSSKDVNLSKLESLLELSVRSTTCIADPFHEDLTFEVAPLSLMTYLTRINRTGSLTTVHSAATAMTPHGQTTSSTTSTTYQTPTLAPQSPMQVFDAFTLNYKVSWPVSLVISKAALTKYQLLFRHLFKCKWVERQLCNTWNVKFRRNQDRQAFAGCYALRQRMLHFLQNFEYYMVNEVIDTNWHEMISKMEAAKNVDEVIKIHNDFLDTCLGSSMLTNNKLFKTLTELIASCTLFAGYYRELCSNQVDGSVASNSALALHSDEAIKRFSSKFDTAFGVLLNQLGTASIDKHLTHLLQRLDFNEYYGNRQSFYHGGRP
eukprot:TRINITY_DN3172_c0_g1_i1.p1 TRINITY_DN3172_c0_g1~~TRINITY_DN3172_c0_g1_i1.p1  ORF type:complete len:645 (+),score=62.16 TRINITY_DN3172_c0_g1_i1:40-1974(+)